MSGVRVGLGVPKCILSLTRLILWNGGEEPLLPVCQVRSGQHNVLVFRHSTTQTSTITGSGIVHPSRPDLLNPVVRRRDRLLSLSYDYLTLEDQNQKTSGEFPATSVEESQDYLEEKTHSIKPNQRQWSHY